jgi:hypothetical protein
MLINKKHVKDLAKEYGKQRHEKDLQVSADFMQQINDIVHMIVMTNTAKQDNLAGTLRATEWGHDRLQAAFEFLGSDIPQS